MSKAPNSDRSLTWKGVPVPCQVRVVVYQAGHAAAVGLRCTDRQAMAHLLASEGFRIALPALLEGEIRAEISWQGVTTGLLEEAIAEAVGAFIEAAAGGITELVSRRIAEGQLPESAEDARLQYILNPDYVPLWHMGVEERRRLGGRVHQVRAGQTLVMRRPPRDARPGVTVRGEPISPGKGRGGQALSSIAGLNTQVRGERLVAGVDGIYREDGRGRARVVQELEVDRVSRATGDLPRSGVAAVNIHIREGVLSGASVQTTEDLFVGTAGEPGVVEAVCRVRAGNLLVRGVISGAGVPEAVVTGEVDSLDESHQQRVRVELEASQVLADGVLAAREITGRNVSGGTILIQEAARHALLESRGDTHVDGDLVGGVAICGGVLSVAGDLGSAVGGLTRIRLGMETPESRRRAQLAVEVARQRHLSQERLAALEEHDAVMKARAKKSPYWAALMEDGERPPARPLERRLLVQFLEASRLRKRLDQDLYDAQEESRGLESQLQALGVEDDEAVDGVRVTVGGTAHAGVSLELVRPMTPADDERRVRDRLGREITLAAVRAELRGQVEHYLGLYESGIEERRQALDEIFEGVEQRPGGPDIPDRRFESALRLDGDGEELLRPEAWVYVRSHAPTAFYMLQRATVREAVRHPVISVEEDGGDLVFLCQPEASPGGRWQEDEEIMAELEAIRVASVSGRQHLLGSSSDSSSRR